jgi:integrase/recombinase XerD
VPASARSLACTLFLVAAGLGLLHLAERAPTGMDEPPDPPVELGGLVTAFGAWSRYETYLRAERGRSKRTVKAYRKTLFDFWAFLGAKRWDQAKPKDLHRFLERPAIAHAKGPYLSANSKASYSAAVRGFYRWAWKSGTLRRDPMALVAAPRQGVPLPRGINASDAATLLSSTEHDLRLHLMVCLAYFQGLRVAEIAGVRVEDCDLRADPSLMLVHGKGGRDRILELHPAVKAVMVAWLARDGLRRVGPLVERLDRPGQALSPGYVSQLLGETLRGLGIPTSAHGLRHTLAMTLRDQGHDVRTIQLALGHASSSTTEKVYLVGERHRAVSAIRGTPDPRKRSNHAHS